MIHMSAFFPESILCITEELVSIEAVHYVLKDLAAY